MHTLYLSVFPQQKIDHLFMSIGITNTINYYKAKIIYHKPIVKLKDVSMDGKIAELIGSDSPENMATVSAVFGSQFQTMGDWRAFLRVNLNGSVSSMLKSNVNKWQVKSFQALYIACWINHPGEKGTL